MQETHTAVVILNWNGVCWLRKFLATVLDTLPKYARLIVADNHSSDSSVSFLQKNFPQVEVLVLDKNYGYTGGYNRALKAIKARYYVLLNSDISPHSKWIEPVIELMESQTEIAACQPKILDYSNPQQFEYAGASGGFIDYLGYPFCRGRIFDTLEEDKGQYNDMLDVFWASGACLFVRAKDFWEAGALDDRFFAHMEEIDLCWRFQRMNKKVRVCPDSVVFHFGGGTLPKKNPRKTFLNFRNNLILLAKNLPRMQFAYIWFFRLFLDALAALIFALKGQFSDALAVCKAHLQWSILLRSLASSSHVKRKRVKGMYKKSIVFQYFIMGKKFFSDLVSTRFKN